MLEPVFTPEQIAQLETAIDAKRVAHRQGGGGSTLSYIEGHEAIDAANRIFSYGNWGFEIVGEPTRDHYTDTNGEIKAMWYTAKVRLHVRGCEPIEEMGLVEVQLPRPGRENTFGQQVDVAMKGAITDALKRALRCYGDQFGNSLYDKALVDGQVKTTNSQQPPTATTPRPVTQPAPRPVNSMPPAPAPVKTPQTAPAPSQAPRPVTPASTPIGAAPAIPSFPVEDDDNFKFYRAKIHQAKSLRDLSDLGQTIKKNVYEAHVLEALRVEHKKAEAALTEKANAKIESFVGASK